MGTFLIALKTVAPLFLIIGIGTLFSRTKAFSQQWIDILNKYALYVGFPALIVASLMYLKPDAVLLSKLVFHTSLYVIVCTLLAFPVARFFKFSKKVLRTLFLILPFGNFAYLGIPVLQNAYGNEMLPTAAIISAIYLFWVLTLPVVLIESFGDDAVHPKKILSSLAKNPLFLSVFVGLAIGFLQINLPFIIDKTIHLFSDSVTAIILFALGLFMGTQKLGNIKEWYLVVGLVFVTMLVLPACYYFYLNATGMEQKLINASVLDAAMPLGLTPYVLTIHYKLESKLAARVVVLGTFLSVFILPLWMVWLG